MILNNRSHICISTNQSTVTFQEARDEVDTQKDELQELMTKFFDCFNDLNYILLKIVIKTSLKTLLYYHFVIFQEARDELETQKDELRDLMTKLEADRDMELEERQKLEEEIRAKQEEIERLQNISTPNFSTLKFSTPSFSTLIFKTLFKSGYNSKHKEPFVKSISEFKFLCHTAVLFCVQSKAVNLTHYV